MPGAGCRNVGRRKGAAALTDYGLEVGGLADFVLVKAENVADAVVRRPRERIVVKGGYIIARDGAFLDSRLSR